MAGTASTTHGGGQEPRAGRQESASGRVGRAADGATGPPGDRFDPEGTDERTHDHGRRPAVAAAGPTGVRAP
jgi:hypothetical protein